MLHFLIPVAAAQTGDEAAAGTLFQVEMLIFRYTDPARTTAEIPRQPRPDMANRLEDDLARLDAGQPTAGMDSGTDSGARTIRLVAEDRWQLQNAAQRLRRLDAYDVIAHIAWTQTAENAAIAVPADISILGVNPAVLSGKVTLFQRRFLHLGMELTLGSAGTDNRVTGSAMTNIRSGNRALPAINESRRIRLERLNYFDQPQFGVLALVTRAP